MCLHLHEQQPLHKTYMWTEKQVRHAEINLRRDLHKVSSRLHINVALRVPFVPALKQSKHIKTSCFIQNKNYCIFVSGDLFVVRKFTGRHRFHLLFSISCIHMWYSDHGTFKTCFSSAGILGIPKFICTARNPSRAFLQCAVFFIMKQYIQQQTQLLNSVHIHRPIIKCPPPPTHTHRQLVAPYSGNIIFLDLRTRPYQISYLQH